MISVVMATYNGERFIERQLESIKNQTCPVDEVIIHDDRSTDGTADTVRRFIADNGLENWKFSVNPENKGYCFNFYGAIAEAEGDIIFLSDQDDVWYPEKVQRMTEAMNKSSDIFSLACRYDVIDAHGRIIENANIPYLGDRFDGSIDELTADSFIGCSHVRGFSMAFRCDVKKYLASLDLTSLLAHDWYINMISTALGRACVLNEKLGAYRWHDNNVSLSGMSRKTLIGDLNKREKGLTESAAAHRAVAQTFADRFEAETVKAMLRQAELEELRLLFLKTKNPFLIFRLLTFSDAYRRYYKFGSRYRVLLGDICYAYRINFKKRK